MPRSSFLPLSQLTFMYSSGRAPRERPAKSDNACTIRRTHDIRRRFSSSNWTVDIDIRLCIAEISSFHLHSPFSSIKSTTKVHISVTFSDLGRAGRPAHNRRAGEHAATDESPFGNFFKFYSRKLAKVRELTLLNDSSHNLFIELRVRITYASKQL